MYRLLYWKIWGKNCFKVYLGFKNAFVVKELAVFSMKPREELLYCNHVTLTDIVFAVSLGEYFSMSFAPPFYFLKTWIKKTYLLSSSLFLLFSNAVIRGENARREYYYLVNRWRTGVLSRDTLDDRQRAIIQLQAGKYYLLSCSWDYHCYAHLMHSLLYFVGSNSWVVVSEAYESYAEFSKFKPWADKVQEKVRKEHIGSIYISSSFYNYGLLYQPVLILNYLFLRKLICYVLWQKQDIEEKHVKVLPSILTELQRRVLKAESTLTQKEEENASLKEQLLQLESKWSENEAKTKSIEEMWQKQVASLQVSSNACIYKVNVLILSHHIMSSKHRVLT